MKKHPLGLYVLFATEMWERFSFYSMVAMFTLYLRDDSGEGFGWTAAEATSLYSNYLMFVFASPLIGGWLADKKLGYRSTVLWGGLFFMVGHLLLAFQSLTAVYSALVCLVIGNGLFKPNVSTMVGNLYPESSPFKDAAYNIFYLGINVGSFLAPIAMELIRSRWGFHPAFAVAALGMVFSIATLWRFRQLVDRSPQAKEKEAETQVPMTAMDAVPEKERIRALLIIYAVTIVFWMAFQQNGSTLTYWADNNTAWEVSGIVSNSINPFWILVFTFPLIAFWRFLRKRDLEPSTPGKMVIGMFLTAISFLVLFLAAKSGESTVSAPLDFGYQVSPFWLLGSYAIVTLAELMISPMGLSLVSKVAPVRYRGLMMGAWFFAGAIGNKLTMIGVYWTEWRHSSFFAILGCLAFVAGLILWGLLNSLKKSIPGI